MSLLLDAIGIQAAIKLPTRAKTDRATICSLEGHNWFQGCPGRGTNRDPVRYTKFAGNQLYSSMQILRRKNSITKIVGSVKKLSLILE